MDNRKLVKHFVGGGKKGQSNSMYIAGNKLIGYGWAVYAKRNKRNNRWFITLYDGWYKYSPTTSKHLNIIRQYADKTLKTKPKL